ncbi:arylamine N-acetyltransferase 4 [Elsinoe ampelina]|uniref:Arylamine N-acetyltransferase 4 n=1 Tax=Elsinoe ampelina TaxID=302913 RepID=A0A6A6G7I2_9PEZI|nr:arylamine N-acetyltransferase 4 [Elsinoe ampelina]
MSHLTPTSSGYSTLLSPPLPSAYTPTQLLLYLQHIHFPLPLTFPRTPSTLLLLHRLQITTIPYENLSLHYSPTHTNSISPHALFEKFISPPAAPGSAEQSAGRGGYCFETAVFWLNILRGLGFRAYSSQARIRLRDGPVPKGEFVGPRHVVTIVVFEDGERWSSDVGFGGDGPTGALRLGDEGAVVNLGRQEVRISRGVFPGTVDGGRNGVWFYEYRNGKEGTWERYYAFGDQEASLWELECANWWVGTHPDSFQRKQVLVVMFLREEREVDGVGEGREAELVRVVGKVMLVDGIVKRNMGGKTEVIKVCKTEAERVDALREYFGITLTDEEKKGIQGFRTELKEA